MCADYFNCNCMHTYAYVYTNMNICCALHFVALYLYSQIQYRHTCTHTCEDIRIGVRVDLSVE